MHPEGKWAAPVVKKRVAAEVRKRAIKEGTFGSFSYPSGVIYLIVLTVLDSNYYII